MNEAESLMEKSCSNLGTSIASTFKVKNSLFRKKFTKSFNAVKCVYFFDIIEFAKSKTEPRSSLISTNFQYNSKIDNDELLYEHSGKIITGSYVPGIKEQPSFTYYVSTIEHHLTNETNDDITSNLNEVGKYKTYSDIRKNEESIIDQIAQLNTEKKNHCIGNYRVAELNTFENDFDRNDVGTRAKREPCIKKVDKGYSYEDETLMLKYVHDKSNERVQTSDIKGKNESTSESISNGIKVYENIDVVILPDHDNNSESKLEILKYTLFEKSEKFKAIDYEDQKSDDYLMKNVKEDSLGETKIFEDDKKTNIDEKNCTKKDIKTSSSMYSFENAEMSPIDGTISQNIECNQNDNGHMTGVNIVIPILNDEISNNVSDESKLNDSMFIGENRDKLSLNRTRKSVDFDDSCTFVVNSNDIKTILEKNEDNQLDPLLKNNIDIEPKGYVAFESSKLIPINEKKQIEKIISENQCSENSDINSILSFENNTHPIVKEEIDYNCNESDLLMKNSKGNSLGETDKFANINNINPDEEDCIEEKIKSKLRTPSFENGEMSPIDGTISQNIGSNQNDDQMKIISVDESHEKEKVSYFLGSTRYPKIQMNYKRFDDIEIDFIGPAQQSTESTLTLFDFKRNKRNDQSIDSKLSNESISLKRLKDHRKIPHMVCNKGLTNDSVGFRSCDGENVYMKCNKSDAHLQSGYHNTIINERSICNVKDISPRLRFNNNNSNKKKSQIQSQEITTYNEELTRKIYTTIPEGVSENMKVKNELDYHSKRILLRQNQNIGFPLCKNCFRHHSLIPTTCEKMNWKNKFLLSVPNFNDIYNRYHISPYLPAKYPPSTEDKYMDTSKYYFNMKHRTEHQLIPMKSKNLKVKQKEITESRYKRIPFSSSSKIDRNYYEKKSIHPSLKIRVYCRGKLIHNPNITK